MADDEPDPSLKTAVIAFAIVEALVLIPVMIYLLVR
jgi:hypothetical protein